MTIEFTFVLPSETLMHVRAPSLAAALQRAGDVSGGAFDIRRRLAACASIIPARQDRDHVMTPADLVWWVPLMDRYFGCTAFAAAAYPTADTRPRRFSGALRDARRSRWIARRYPEVVLGHTVPDDILARLQGSGR